MSLFQLHRGATRFTARFTAKDNHAGPSLYGTVLPRGCKSVYRCGMAPLGVFFDGFTWLNEGLCRLGARKRMYNCPCKGGVVLDTFQFPSKGNTHTMMQSSTRLLPATLAGLTQAGVHNSFYWTPPVANFSGVDSVLTAKSVLLRQQLRMTTEV